MHNQNWLLRGQTCPLAVAVKHTDYLSKSLSLHVTHLVLNDSHWTGAHTVVATNAA